MNQLSEDEQNFADARERVARLRDRLQAGASVPVLLVETHISWVLLSEHDAYKLKKPLRLPFVDFSSLATRRQCCAAELRLNRRLAPAIYRGVVAITDGPDGPEFAGSGPVVDSAVLMRRFDDGSLWSERLATGRLDADQVEAMARRLADFHDSAEVMLPDSPFGTADVHRRITGGLIDAMDEAFHHGSAAAAADFDWPRLRDWLAAQLDSLATFWDERRNNGRVREGHGDLHLANILQLGDQPTAFDAIEFDAELRCIDVIEDIAFPVMDLLANGGAELAWRFLDAYLEVSGDFAGLPALRFFLVRRALVRAEVKDLSPVQPSAGPGACSAAAYRALAARLAFGADPRLAITRGLPGSGKSFVAQRLVAEGGAIRVRSDVERKRRFGIAALGTSQRVGDIYAPQATLQTYQRLLDLARIILLAGWPVVIDAAFLRRAERHVFAALAESLDVPFCIFDCRAPMAILQQRIVRRQALANDPSEADLSVLEALRGVDQGLDRGELEQALVVDTADPQSIEGIANRWLAGFRRGLPDKPERGGKIAGPG